MIENPNPNIRVVGWKEICIRDLFVVPLDWFIARFCRGDSTPRWIDGLVIIWWFPEKSAKKSELEFEGTLWYDTIYVAKMPKYAPEMHRKESNYSVAVYDETHNGHLKMLADFIKSNYKKELEQI